MKNKIVFSLLLVMMLITSFNSGTTVKAKEEIVENNIPELIVDGENIEGEIIDEGEDYVTISYFVPADDIGVNEPRARAWLGYSIRNVRLSSTKTNYNYLVSNDVIARGGSKSMTINGLEQVKLVGVPQ